MNNNHPSPTYIEIDGNNIQIFDNRADGEAVFIFHANSGSAELSLNVFDSYLARSNRIIVVSLVGHGKSDRSVNPDTDYSIPGIGNFIAKVVDSFQLPAYWLVACSISAHAIFGAYDRFTFAKGLVALSAAPINQELIQYAFHKTEIMPLLFKGDLSELDAFRLAAHFTSYTAHIPVLVKSIQAADPLFRIKLGESIANGFLLDETDVLTQAKFPILFIQSLNDPFINSAYFSLLRETTGSDLDIVLLKDGGHTILLDNPKDAIEAIVLFISTHA